MSRSATFDPIARGVQVLPVAVGLTSWITTDYVAENMHLLDVADRNGAFMIYFACGVHFVASFLLAVPLGVLFIGCNRSWWMTFAIIASFFTYIFWSMINAQTMVAELFTYGSWRIPMAGVAETVSFGRKIHETGYFFYFPLLIGWTVFLVLLVALSPLGLFRQRR